MLRNSDINKIIRGVTLFLAVLAVACTRKYTVEGNKVYFNYWNEGSGSNKWAIDSADATTFTAVELDCDCSFKFGRDKRHLFIDGIPMKGIDPESFKFVGHYIFRDKDSAYFFGFYNDINHCVISGVNPDKIKLLSYPWAIEANTLIHGSSTLLLDDISEFEPINEDWGKTKNRVLNENRVLKGADPESFKVINSFTGKDKNNTYQFGKIKNSD